MNKEINQHSHILGIYATEALAEIDHYEPETLVSIPSLDAVERGKAWIEENQK